MLPMDGKHRWMFVVETAILFYGIFLGNRICESSGSLDTNEICPPKRNVLFTSAKKPYTTTFTSGDFVCEEEGTKLCFHFQGNNADCCNDTDFDCSFERQGTENNYSLKLNYETLSNQDIVLMKEPHDLYNCFFNETPSGCLLNIDKCLNKCQQNVRLSHYDDLKSNCQTNDGETCKGAKYNLTIYPYDGNRCVKCKPPEDISTTTASTTADSTTSISTTAPSTTTIATIALSTTSVSTTAPSTTTVYTTAPSTTTVSTTAPSTTTISTTADSTTSVSTTAFSTTASPTWSNNGTSTPRLTSLENAVIIMKGICSTAERMCHNCTKNITFGEIKGVIRKLPRDKQTDISIESQTTPMTAISRSVQIPKEACEQAIRRNGSFAGVVIFPGIHQNDSNSSFVNNEVMGIEMGAKIANLSHTIDIRYKNVDKNGSIASCRSWNGKGEPIWITDGCRTIEIDGSITCQCSHLTFFAILLSPPTGNISASDFTNLSYITSIGCGLSMFFLAVALFMHCLIRKGRTNQATTIMMNLFVAMFTLNLSFLVNESVANMGNFGACVTIAAVMHYTMLATFSWFFMEALHLFFHLRRLPTEIKHYMAKICVTGWATPAVVVIALLASGKYEELVIYTDDGNSAKMCWISDAAVHQGVNLGYYAIVFLFTLSIFILTVREIVLIRRTDVKARHTRSIKKNSSSIMGLFTLLGITWAVAFFSYGPLLIPSYYIFTILNSFQGFFLFIYYYKSSKAVGADGGLAVGSSSSTATSNTVVTSPT